MQNNLLTEQPEERIPPPPRTPPPTPPFGPPPPLPNNLPIAPPLPPPQISISAPVTESLAEHSEDEVYELEDYDDPDYLLDGPTSLEINESLLPSLEGLDSFLIDQSLDPTLDESSNLPTQHSVEEPSAARTKETTSQSASDPAMAAEQRKLLEQLMGDTLMGNAQPKGPVLSITDPKVCRSYLVGTCPHDLFTNTKNDLGPCQKQHSEALKAEYEAADEEQKRRWGFEFDYQRDMQRHIDECNRRIDTAQKRLEKTADEVKQTNALLKQISDLKESLEIMHLEIQTLGEQGHVWLATEEFHKYNVMQQQKAERERELRALNDLSGPSGHQKLQVCDVCGAYLSRLDNDRRLADHFFGKMHLGYAQMRRTAEKLQEELKGRAPPPRQHESFGTQAGTDGGFGDGGASWNAGGRGGFGGRGRGRGSGSGGGFRGRGGRGGGGYGDRW